MDAKLSEIPSPKLISALRSFDLLPAIVFLPTRRKCDDAASDVAADRSQKTDVERYRRRQEIFDDFAALNPEILNHKHRKIIVQTGVASHHAGHIPAWKLLIEKMMSAGLLNAIFATSTVAAGVDFPARTVVISNADTRGNDGWRPLKASELQQMTGRAGRRGKDLVGFVILAPGQFQNPKKIAELLKAPPDPLESQFRATYTSLLNLLDAFGGFAPVREIAEKSFAFRDTRHRVDELERKRKEQAAALHEKISSSNLGIAFEDVLGYERLASSVKRLHRKFPATRAELRHDWLRENVIPGRIITQGRNGKRLFLVLNIHGEKVSAMRDDGQGASIELSRVNKIYGKKYPVKESAVEKAFFEVLEGKNKALAEPKISFKSADDNESVQLLSGLIEKLIPHDMKDTDRSRAHQFFIENLPLTESIRKFERDVEFLRSGIWLPFEKRAKVLGHFGFLDFVEEKVTERGKWLADLRVDRPLLVGEALSRGVFDDLLPKHTAGLMAAIAADAERDYGELYLSDPLIAILSGFEDVIFDVGKIELKFGIEPVEEVNYSAAASAERWVAGMKWEDLVSRTKAEEGDLVRLLSRTGEALLQVANLKETNPNAANLARTAAEIVLREPVR